MATKSTNRRSANQKKSSAADALREQYEHPLEDALAYEHSSSADEDHADEGGYLAHAASRVRELTRQREGRVVIAALATGFAIGAAIGVVIAGSRQRQQTWSERLACEGLGRRMLDRLSSMVPDSISEKIHR